MRIVNVAAAQMGPLQKADSREAVVKRMTALMDEALRAEKRAKSSVKGTGSDVSPAEA